jgi:hypothetical protein
MKPSLAAYSNDSDASDFEDEWEKARTGKKLVRDKIRSLRKAGRPSVDQQAKMLIMQLNCGIRQVYLAMRIISRHPIHRISMMEAETFPVLSTRRPHCSS